MRETVAESLPAQLTRKFKTFPERLIVRIFLKLFQQQVFSRCCYSGGRRIGLHRRLVLMINEPQYIHFGDSLWFEPIARLLATKYNVVVCANPALNFYFGGLGYKIIAKEEILPSDVLVTRPELCFRLKKLDVLWVNFDYENWCAKPLIEEVLDSISMQLNIPLTNVSASPKPIIFSEEDRVVLLEKFALVANKRYVIFNNYIDSHIRSTLLKLPGAKKRLINFVRDYKQKHNVEIIHTGTLSDKNKDEQLYCGLVDVDLRGKTTVSEAFGLIMLDNVMAYVGFDTFWLHLANMYQKSSYIVLKPGYSFHYDEQVKNYVLVPFRSAVKRVNLIA